VLVLLIVVQSLVEEKTVSKRAEGILDRIEAVSGTGGLGRSAISDRISSITGRFLKRKSSENKVIQNSEELREKAIAKALEVNKRKRRMLTYSEKKLAAKALRRGSVSEKKDLRRIG